MVLQTAVLPKNKQYEGKTLGQIAKAQGKGIIDAFLDLAIEENLDTEWLHGENNVDEAAVAKILTYPNAIIGLSDGGAHVQFQSGFGFSTRLLSEWVRDKQVDDPGAGGAAADLRQRFDLRALRPRPVAARHGRRHRDLRPRYGEARCRSRWCTTSRPAPSASRSRPRAS